MHSNEHLAKISVNSKNSQNDDMGNTAYIKRGFYPTDEEKTRTNNHIVMSLQKK